jgi:hypothetical protein
MAEFKVEVPGMYINVDHAIFRIAKGAVGLIMVLRNLTLSRGGRGIASPFLFLTG